MKFDIERVITDKYFEKMLQEDPAFAEELTTEIKKNLLASFKEADLTWVADNVFDNMDTQKMSKVIERKMIEALK